MNCSIKLHEGDLVILKEEYLGTNDDPMQLFEVMVSYEDLQRCIIKPIDRRSDRPEELVSWDMITLKIRKEDYEKLKRR